MPVHLPVLYVLINVLVFLFAFLILLVQHILNYISMHLFLVTTGSMEPAIPTGSLIYTEKTYDPRIGDLVIFSLNNEVIAHRIVNKFQISGETYFSTKGDANLLTDLELIHESYIYGKISAIMPTIGTLAMLSKAPGALTLSIAMYSIFIFIGHLLWAYGYQKKILTIS